MRGARVLRWAVATVLFLNAFLVFVLQPHISKRLLPVLGGSAEVWLVCTLFFQLALLGGYGAAYLARRLPMPGALALHAALAGIAWLLWPFSVGEGPPPGASPALWTLQLLAGQVGLLFAILSSTSPLLQMAYARAAPNLDPYPLFAASNAGSLLGLCAYPLIVEPLLTLEGQAHAWSAGASGLLGLLVLTGTLLVRGHPPSTAPADDPQPEPTAHQRRRWLVLSLVPSVLLLSVTSQITTDIAPIPLLWMVPLGLYLGSLIRVFSQGWRPSRWTWAAMAVFSLPTLLVFAYEPGYWGWIVVHLTILWCGALLCHGALAQERPVPARLAEFYLWLALGGALGGVLAVVAAPLAFTMRAEYPLAVLAVLWLAPTSTVGGSQVRLSWRLGLGLGVIGVLAAIGLVYAASAPPALRSVFVLLPAVAAIVVWHRPRVFAVASSITLVAAVVGRQLAPDGFVERGRTFYGTHAVRDLPATRTRALFHGTTLHGLQSLRPEQRREPLSYYGRFSPVAQVFREQVGRGARVAMIGLGVGEILCYAQPGSEWTVYEVDPAIARVARNPALFSYWSEASVTPALVIGDGRLRLREAPDGAYDLIVVDAFASDTIPVHLVTREALSLYVRKLRPEGAILFHVSNRYVDLAPVLGATASSLGLVAYARTDGTDDAAAGLFPSTWVLLPKAAMLAVPPAGWSAVPVQQADSAWTDDYSNVFSVLRVVRAARDVISAELGY